MNLAAIPSPTTAAWQLGPLTLRAYALCIIIGIFVACWVTERRMRQRGAPPYLVLDVAIWAVPLGIIGARIYHVISSWQFYFSNGANPWDAFVIWHGGLGIWGGVAGGALGAWIACRQRGIPLSFVADALAPGLPLAQAIGRWGNWFNNELYGKPTNLPWGLRVYEMNGTQAQLLDGHPLARPGLYQPTFLYESLWDVGVAVLVWTLDRRYRFGRGRAFALYVMAYTVGRFWVEALRIDEANHVLGLRLNDWTSIVVFLAALIYFVRVRGPQLWLVAGEDGKLRAVPAGEAAAQDGAARAGSDGDGDTTDGDTKNGDTKPVAAGENPPETSPDPPPAATGSGGDEPAADSPVDSSADSPDAPDPAHSTSEK